MISTKISDSGPRAFVVGFPIEHSRSPVIHNYWLNLHGISGSYQRVSIAPDDFDSFISKIREGEFDGGNVTMPHKEAAFNAADFLTERAKRLRSVNTLWVENGLLCGDNTDIIGFTANLDQALTDGWHKGVSHALVIGAGGAARAVIAGLLSYPDIQITVINRTMEKARDLILYNQERIKIADWKDISHIAKQAGLIINTTSLGMKGFPPLDVDLSHCNPNTIVSDIVYIPIETPILKQAKLHSLRTVDGLGMLLHQAVYGFKQWFGVKPEVTPQLREVVLRDIGGIQ